MNKILITGGSGFLGGYLIKAAKYNFDVYATHFHNLPQYSDCHWLKLDLSEPSEIERTIKQVSPQVIIHNAAVTDVDFCDKNQELAKNVNIRASEVIAKTGRTLSARILYISTDLVFDGKHPPYSEENKPNPINFYGWTKWQAEESVAANNPYFVIVRPAIIFGPPAIAGTSFSEWMVKSWQNGKITNLFTDQYRTPIFSKNLAAATVEIAQTDFTGIIHFAGLERINRYHFGLHLADLLKLDKNLIKSSTMAEVALPTNRPADVSLRTDLAQNLLQTKFLSAKEGIRQAYS